MTVDYAITLTYIAAFCIRKHISVVADLSSRGVATGVYRYIYPPKSVYLTHFYVVTGVFFSLTQDKFDIVPVCALARVSFAYYLHATIYTPPQMKFLATALLSRLRLPAFSRFHPTSRVRLENLMQLW